MLDDDDLLAAVVVAPSSGPPWLVLLGIVLVVAVAIAVLGNESDCADKACQRGSPVLIEGACRCLESAK